MSSKSISKRRCPECKGKDTYKTADLSGEWFCFDCEVWFDESSTVTHELVRVEEIAKEEEDGI